MINCSISVGTLGTKEYIPQKLMNQPSKERSVNTIMKGTPLRPNFIIIPAITFKSVMPSPASPSGISKLNIS